jgi:hypothetical protein
MEIIQLLDQLRVSLLLLSGVARSVHTHFVEIDIILAATPAQLLEAVERAFQERLDGQGEVLRWAITALNINPGQGPSTATVQAVTLML